MPTLHHPIAGPVRFEPLAQGAIRLLDNWEQKNISTVFIPELKGIPTYTGLFSGNVRFYTRAIPQFKAAWAEVGRAGLRSKVLFWSGSFVPRMKRGSTTSPSNHTVGTAFDINHQQNPFRQKPAAVGAAGDVHAIATIFKRYGFLWGGDWKNTPDGMHFEVAKLLAASYLNNPTSGPAIQPEPVAPAKPRPKLILAIKGASNAIRYEHLESAVLDNGRFSAEPADILQELLNVRGPVPVVDFLKRIHANPYHVGNHLDDDKEPRMYLYVDASGTTNGTTSNGTTSNGV